MRIVAVLLSVMVLFGCSVTRNKKTFELNANDFDSIAEETFKLIDPKGAITIVAIPAGLDPRAQAALGKQKKIVQQSQIPQSANVVLPQGYFSLKAFTVSIADGEAEIDGQLGPVTRALTAANVPDCGKNYTVQFYLEDGDWVSHSYKLTTCDETLHWVPVDSGE